jgi:hypothetical protein
MRSGTQCAIITAFAAARIIVGAALSAGGSCFLAMSTGGLGKEVSNLESFL